MSELGRRLGRRATAAAVLASVVWSLAVAVSVNGQDTDAAGMSRIADKYSARLTFKNIVISENAM